MKHLRSLPLVFTCAVALMGCSETTPPTASHETPASSSDPAPTSPDSAPVAPPPQPTGRFAEELRNVDYPIDTTSNGTASLKDGVYEESVAGSSSRTVVRLGPNPAFGDLNGDGVEDAAVILIGSPGGSGVFTYVSAVLNANGAARPTGSLLIGDRITLQSMRIVDGKIEVTWLDRKPGEPMGSAPATRVRKAFVVQGGTLVAVASAGSDTSDSIEQLRGHYTWGAEVETFRPCGSNQSFWVVGDKALLQPLRDRSAELGRSRGKTYQPIYVEASGVPEGKATDGFAMDYDGVYRLKAVQTVTDTSPTGCRTGR